MTRRRTYGQWHRHGATDDDDDNGDGATDNNGDEDDDGDCATDDNGDGDGATDDDDGDDDDGDDSDGAVDDDDVDDNNNDVDNIDGNNLPPRVGKRNDGCDETKTKEEETVTGSVEIGDTQQSNRSQGGGVVDGDDYDDGDNGQQRR